MSHDIRVIPLTIQTGDGSGPAFTNFALNQTTDKLEKIFQVQTSDAITRMFLRHGSTTGTSPTYRISLQGVDSDGNPDGTVKGGGTPASATFSPSSLSWAANTVQEIALSNSYTPTLGEYLAAVIDYSSGTVNGSNFSSFTRDANAATIRFPYAIQNDDGARSRFSNSPLIMGYGTASHVFGDPFDTITSLGWNSGSTPVERGIKFTLPTSYGSTYKLCGILFGGNMTSGGTTRLRLYSGGGAADTTVLQTVDRVHTYLSATTNNTHRIDFTGTLSTLSTGQTYRVSLEPLTANNFTTSSFVVAHASHWGGTSLGDAVEYTTRSGGNWTDVPLQRPLISLLISDVTMPTGGGVIVPVLAGRII